MHRFWQRLLLITGVGALLFLLVEIGLTVAATQHGSTPARTVQATAGPYSLQVSLYDDPARAGFALPFAIAPQGAAEGALTYQVTSYPVGNIPANPVRATFGPDASVPDGVQGYAEITVRGPWVLHIEVDGSAGHGITNVPLEAVTLPQIPAWVGWLVGGLPLYGLAIYIVLQRRAVHRRATATP